MYYIFYIILLLIIILIFHNNENNNKENFANTCTDDVTLNGELKMSKRIQFSFNNITSNYDDANMPIAIETSFGMIQTFGLSSNNGLRVMYGNLKFGNNNNQCIIGPNDTQAHLDIVGYGNFPTRRINLMDSVIIGDLVTPRTATTPGTVPTLILSDKGTFDGANKGTLQIIRPFNDYDRAHISLINAGNSIWQIGMCGNNNNDLGFFMGTYNESNKNKQIMSLHSDDPTNPTPVNVINVNARIQGLFQSIGNRDMEKPTGGLPCMIETGYSYIKCFGLWSNNGINVNGGDVNIPSGNLTALSCNCPSDKRLKHNIKELDSVYESIKKLTPVSYEWKKDNKNDFGLIAQEYYKIFPFANKTELIGEEPVDKTGDPEYYSVDYSKLSVILLQGLKETMNKLEEQILYTNKLENIINERLNKLEKNNLE